MKLTSHLQVKDRVHLSTLLGRQDTTMLRIFRTMKYYERSLDHDKMRIVSLAKEKGALLSWQQITVTRPTIRRLLSFGTIRPNESVSKTWQRCQFVCDKINRAFNSICGLSVCPKTRVIVPTLMYLYHRRKDSLFLISRPSYPEQ